ncbi:MAG: hypothetical protein ABEJ07_04090 [Candidatus Nanohaloarchaea archaeon]
MNLVSRLLSGDDSPESEPEWDRTASHLDVEGIKVDPVMQMEQADERYFPHIFSKAVEELDDEIGASLDIPGPVMVEKDTSPPLFSETEFDQEREKFVLHASPGFTSEPRNLKKAYKITLHDFLMGELHEELEGPRHDLLGRQ